MMQTYGYGKLIIGGEYSVLFGELALACAVNRVARGNFTNDINYSFIGHSHSNILADDSLFNAAYTVCSSLGLTPKSGNYRIDTSEFYDPITHEKYGLGSSAAATVALCRLIFLQYNCADKSLLLKAALKTHQLFSKGFGSGVDVATSLYGGCISYILNNNQPNIHKIHKNQLLDDFILINTHHPQDTRHFVQKVIEFNKANELYIKTFKESSSLFLKKFLNEQNQSDKISAINGLFDLLNNLTHEVGIKIISDKHNLINKLARSYDGGAKPSGAGGGDYAIAIVPAKNRSEFISEIPSIGCSVDTNLMFVNDDTF